MMMHHVISLAVVVEILQNEKSWIDFIKEGFYSDVIGFVTFPTNNGMLPNAHSPFFFTS